MYCPTCQTVMRVDEALCPTCGDAIHPIRATDVVEVVESSATSAAFAERVDFDTSGDTVITITGAMDAALVASGKKPMSLLARLPELSLLAWRQPAIRSAVKTGAGAIMLSLTMRAARQWLLEPRRRRTATDSLRPALGELLRPTVREQRRWQGRGVEVTETFIYIRRTLRR